MGGHCHPCADACWAPAWAQDQPPPRGAERLGREGAGHRPALHDRDRQPAGQRCRRRRAGTRRQRRRCHGGGAVRAEPGRAAVVGHRRRRVHALLGCEGEAAHQLRRARDRAGGGRAGPVSASRTARRWRSRRRSPAADRSACQGRWRCSSWRTGCTAGCPGPSWSTPAAELAEQGFEISPRLAGGIADSAAKLRAVPGDAGLLPGRGRGAAPGGHAAAQSGLRGDACARSPPRAARRSTAAGSATRSSRPCATRRSTRAMLTREDLAGYRAVLREPVCRPYRAYEVCGMGPPSSGGVAVLQILGLLEHFDMAGLGPIGGRDAGAARGLQARLRRPQPLPRRQRLRPRAGQGAARPGLPDGAGAADPAGRIDGQGCRRQPALARGRSCWRRTRARSCPAPASSSSSMPTATRCR